MYYKKSIKFWLLLAFGFIVNTLWIQGSAIKWLKVRSESQRIDNDIASAEDQILKIKARLKKTKQPSFMDKQAIENLNLSAADDLIFVFSE